MNNGKPSLNVEHAVRERYSGAARQAEQALCCPIDYDTRYLDVLPEELIQRDYGCGDPSRYLEAGERVLDLGSGGGKVCYIASQVVGPDGWVIGIDVNEDMLDLAKRYQQQIGAAIGHHNTDFRRGRIEDLALDLDRFEEHLCEHPVDNSRDWIRAAGLADEMRRSDPMVPDDSIDVIISNCVLNLVDTARRRQLFSEMFRVLRRGGRVVISDIVSDEPVPDHMRADATLWSGCISGAFVEHEFLREFEQAGFYGIEVLTRQDEAWATVEGIEFRSVTVRAFKGKQGPCMDHNQAVIYNGPWRSVTDDDGHVLTRGVRTAACEKTFQIYSRPPYRQHVTPLPPREEVAAEDAQPFNCRRNAARDPRETKGKDFNLTSLPDGGCCGPSDGCC